MRFAARATELVLVVVLAGCAGITPVIKVETGETVLRERLAVQVDTPWNKFPAGPDDSIPIWTVEGITVDALRFYVGIKDGELIAPTPANRKGVEPLTFKAAMQPAEIVALYQSLLTRDGSSFTLDRIEVTDFVGTRGFRFDYSLVRKVDDVRLRGVAWAAVHNGELFVIQYSAPRLAFFPKHVAQVEAIARSARVKT